MFDALRPTARRSARRERSRTPCAVSLLGRIPFATVPGSVRSVVFVSGASGVLGSRLVRTLVESGWSVRALVQPNDPFRGRLDGLGCDLREGDLAHPETLRGVLDGV